MSSVGRSSARGSPSSAHVNVSGNIACTWACTSPRSRASSTASSSAVADSAYRPASSIAPANSTSVAPRGRDGPGGVSERARSSSATARSESRFSARSPASVRKRNAVRLEPGGVLGSVGRLRQVQRRRVVVGEDVGDILDTVSGSRFDPLRRGDMARGAGGSRQRRVRDVARQNVPERVLASRPPSTWSGRVERTPSGSTLPEPSSTVARSRSPIAARPRPRTPSRRRRHRRAVTSRRPGRASRRAASSAWIDSGSGSDRSLAQAQDAVRPLEDVAILEQPNELLDEQRIALGAIEDGSAELGSDDSGIEQLVGESSGGVGRQRPEIDPEGRRVQGRAAVTQLRVATCPR